MISLIRGKNDQIGLFFWVFSHLRKLTFSEVGIFGKSTFSEIEILGNSSFSEIEIESLIYTSKI